MRALLDVNVLIALLDADHIEHATARAWLGREIDNGWASCPITENGFVRILSQPRYPSPVPPTEAIRRLAVATRGEHHEFWPCDATLLDAKLVDSTRLHSAKQVTDVYLLALAVAKGGRFVTFDRTIPLSAVIGARSQQLVVI